jgi:hypothetical protein
MSDWNLKSYEYYAKKYGEQGDKDVLKTWDKEKAKKYGEGSDRDVARISAEDIRRMAEEGAGLKNIVSAYDSGQFDKYRHGGGTERMVDAFRGSLGDDDGGGKGDGEGGGKRTTGIDDKGLTDYGEYGSMTPAAFDLFKEIKLRKLDGKNARSLQGIINAGKTDVAAIQRDASIYGSLVSGFW